jgi:hypothetical protein
MCYKVSISCDICDCDMEVKKVEKVKQHKRLVITATTLLLLALILAGVYWQTMPGGSQPSPSPSLSPSLSPESPPIDLLPQEILPRMQ